MTEDTNWDALLDERLSENRRRQRDDAQAAEPPPGPQAAEELLDRIRTAAENGDLPGSQPAPEDAPPPPPPSPEAPSKPYLPTSPAPPRPRRRRPSSVDLHPIAYTPETADWPGRTRRHHHRLNLHRLKRVAFWLVLFLLLAGGILLTFWPGLLKDLGFRDEPLTPPIIDAKDEKPKPPPKKPEKEPGPRTGDPGPGSKEPKGRLPEELPREDPPPPELRQPEASKPGTEPEKKRPPLPVDDILRTAPKRPALPKMPVIPGPFSGPDGSKITPPGPATAPKPPLPPKPKKKISKSPD